MDLKIYVEKHKHETKLTIPNTVDSQIEWAEISFLLIIFSTVRDISPLFVAANGFSTVDSGDTVCKNSVLCFILLANQVRLNPLRHLISPLSKRELWMSIVLYLYYDSEIKNDKQS